MESNKNPSVKHALAIDRWQSNPDICRMNKDVRLIDRSGLFIISYQLEGLCNGLRLTVPHGLKPGKETIQIIEKLLADFAAILKGTLLDNLPKISESSNPVDILVFAETLRTSVLAFLSPEEVTERRKIGFNVEPNE